jgi:hypothetical protein
LFGSAPGERHGKVFASPPSGATKSLLPLRLKLRNPKPCLHCRIFSEVEIIGFHSKTRYCTWELIKKSELSRKFTTFKLGKLPYYIIELGHRYKFSNEKLYTFTSCEKYHGLRKAP